MHIIFSIFFNLMILLIILLLIDAIAKKYELKNKKFILILVPLLILNVVVTSKYIQIKNSNNASTYITYDLVKDAFEEIRYPNDIKNKEDMKKLVGVVEDISKMLNIFEFNLRDSSMADESDRFYSLFKGLKDNLNQFINQHDKYFVNNEKITTNRLEKYEELKVQLVMIQHYLSRLHSSRSRKFGVERYRLYLSGKEKYDWILKLEERVSNIENIVRELDEKNN